VRRRRSAGATTSRGIGTGHDLVTARVVAVHLDERCFPNGHPDYSQFRPLGASASSTADRGATGGTLAFAAATSALAIPGVVYCVRVSMLTAQDFVRAVWRPVTASLLGAGMWVLVRDRLATPDAMMTALVLDGFVFMTLYAAAWIALPGGRQATEEGVRLIRELSPYRPSHASAAPRTASEGDSPS
jgi:hypothetical protein